MLLVLVVVGLALGNAASAQEKETKEVTQALQALNKAFVDQDKEALERLLAEDHVAITLYYGKPLKRAEQVKMAPELKLTEYRPGAMQVRLIAKDVALVTYPLFQKGTMRGLPVSQYNYASALWVKRDGRWQETFYQETPLASKK
jgi:hypothetical protein